MKISDLMTPVQVELPNTDAMAVLRNPEAVQRFITEHGDVDVVISEWGDKAYTVPAFSDGREAFKVAKGEFCSLYGCD